MFSGRISVSTWAGMWVWISVSVSLNETMNKSMTVWVDVSISLIFSSSDSVIVKNVNLITSSSFGYDSVYEYQYDDDFLRWIRMTVGK